MKSNHEEIFNYGEWFDDYQLEPKVGHDLSVNNNAQQTDTIETLTEEFYSVLEQVIKGTVKGIKRLSEIVNSIRELNGDVSFAKKYLGGLIIDVADGKVSPDMAASFWGKPTLLKAISKLSKRDQEALINGQKVTLVIPTKEGTFGIKEKNVGDISPSEIPLVVENGKIKSIKEQKEKLVDRASRSLKRLPATPKFTTHGNYKKGNTYGRIGDEYITINDIFKALADKYNTTVHKLKLTLDNLSKAQ